MASRRFLLVQRRNSVGYVVHRSSLSCSASARTWWLPCVPQASAGHRSCSSVAKVQEVDVSATKWHGLPPVPKQGQRWTTWELNNARRTTEERASAHGDEKGREQKITALRWVTKCCSSLPNSLLHKLFRLRQVRRQALLPNSLETQQQERASDMKKLETRMRRMQPLCCQHWAALVSVVASCVSEFQRFLGIKVSGKAVLEEGTVLYLPKSVFQNQVDSLPVQDRKKTEHQPTKEEVKWLQSLVLYKMYRAEDIIAHGMMQDLQCLFSRMQDPEILLINKPPGLPVQGGTEIKRSLDSLMGTALSFDYNDGPRLVHRLDKETSGLMVLARTQECARLLHALFREKTTTVMETRNTGTNIERCYQALVIGTPKQSQGRITAPLIKVVLDEGRVDKTMVAHDLSSANAQVAITDYKVLDSSYLGCTWLELQPLTGRKHQLRVHCAEVLGTPVLGDMRYGWRTHKEWFKKKKSQGSEALGLEGAIGSVMNLEVVEHVKNVKGSVLAKLPFLHLHCCRLTLPSILKMLVRDKSRINPEDMTVDRVQFVAPLPPHMAASWELWTHNSSTLSKLNDGLMKAHLHC